MQNSTAKDISTSDISKTMGPSNKLLSELQLTEYAVKFMPWRKLEGSDGTVIYFNTKTNKTASNPDSEIVKLLDKLETLRNAVKDAQAKQAEMVFKEWLANNMIQKNLDTVNNELLLLKDKVTHLQFEVSYYKDQSQKYSEQIMSSEKKQKENYTLIIKSLSILQKEQDAKLESENQDDSRLDKSNEVSNLKKQYSLRLAEKDQKIIELQSCIIDQLNKLCDITDLKMEHSTSLNHRDQQIIDIQNQLINWREKLEEVVNNDKLVVQQKDQKIYNLQNENENLLLKIKVLETQIEEMNEIGKNAIKDAQTFSLDKLCFRRI